jgi:Uncharacterized protein conserved in bacteria
MARGLVSKRHYLMRCDTAKYVVRGGHASLAVKAMLGSALHIKPLITLDVAIRPFGKAIGRAGSVRALHKYIDSFPPPRILGVECSTDTREAEKFAEQLKKRFPSVPIYISTLSPVVGAHAGPEVLSVSMIEK